MLPKMKVIYFFNFSCTLYLKGPIMSTSVEFNSFAKKVAIDLCYFFS